MFFCQTRLCRVAAFPLPSVSHSSHRFSAGTMGATSCVMYLKRVERIICPRLDETLVAIKARLGVSPRPSAARKRILRLRRSHSQMSWGCMYETTIQNGTLLVLVYR